ncbi:hypothetical protein M2132_000540 [Dysgonomonas sp. PH5-45]|uniref:YbbR-like domain-containing protein n=1 Tax=unclassified Dysgonomonas TaxID=2630389 RepID=UPI0024743CE7|nr:MULTISPECIES: YbbR-like domain-containing protein [unclassified Dysgonomonas]MDH6354213.1 hypothetical protein [Dysgonomonas sp. PH5-45]MDH6387114.1 hypothetical protein [Dysgonomonas sp. PH5-37]
MGNIGDEILKKVRTSFAKLTWNKVLTFSVFIILAAVFWLMQVYRETFESTIKIAVEYKNIPDSIVIENTLPEKVSVRIKDKGIALFRYFFSRNNEVVTIDVGALLKNKSHTLQSAVYEELLRGKLLKTSEMISYSPARIYIEFDVLKSKKVPVVFDGTISLSPGYLLTGDILLYPDSVTIFGPEDVLKKTNFAYTVNDTIEDLKTRECIPTRFRTIKNIKYVPDKVELEIPVEEYLQKDITAPIKCVNLPENLDIRMFPSSSKISFFVGRSRYKEVITEDFIIEIDYNELIHKKEMKAPLRLTSSPTYVRNISLNPSEIEFVFEEKDNKVKKK